MVEFTQVYDLTAVQNVGNSFYRHFDAATTIIKKMVQCSKKFLIVFFFLNKQQNVH